MMLHCLEYNLNICIQKGHLHYFIVYFSLRFLLFCIDNKFTVSASQTEQPFSPARL
jgi:hypothetical protein